MEGVRASSAKQKLRFCSEAVEAIASVVNSSNFNLTKAAQIAPLLERDEIDFIQDMLLSDDLHDSEYDSNPADNKRFRHYGT
jgi:hypothetical protein